MKKVLFCAIAIVAMSGAAKAADLSDSGMLKHAEFPTSINFERDIRIDDVVADKFWYKIYDSKGSLVAEGTYYCNGSSTCTADFAIWLYNATPAGGKADSGPL